MSHKISLFDFRKRKSLLLNISGETSQVDKMIVEVGDIDDDISISDPRHLDELKTALSNRDSLIRRLLVITN